MPRKAKFDLKTNLLTKITFEMKQIDKQNFLLPPIYPPLAEEFLSCTVRYPLYCIQKDKRLSYDRTGEIPTFR